MYTFLLFLVKYFVNDCESIPALGRNQWPSRRQPGVYISQQKIQSPTRIIVSSRRRRINELVCTFITPNHAQHVNHEFITAVSTAPVNQGRQREAIRHADTNFLYFSHEFENAVQSAMPGAHLDQD